MAYGIEAIPQQWLNGIAKAKEVRELAERFALAVRKVYEGRR